MFSLTVSAKRMASWKTIPSRRRRLARVTLSAVMSPGGASLALNWALRPSQSCFGLGRILSPLHSAIKPLKVDLTNTLNV